VSAQSIALLSESDRVAKITTLSNGLVLPYTYMALTLFALAVLLKFSSLPDLILEKPQSGDAEVDSLKVYPQLILGIVTLFLYVGVEVIVGDIIGLFCSTLLLYKKRIFIKL
jgi:FHS family L-fucose permease-like MFS transporter